MNPLLWKEMKVGLRERRIFVFHVLFLIVVALVALWRLFGLDGRSDFTGYAEEGQGLHLAMILVMSGLLLLVTPALTAGAISSERERQSLDLLLSSGATPGQIAGGKGAYAMAYVGLLLVSAMPLDALAFFLGGVSPGAFLSTYLVLGALALVLAWLGLFVSARERRTAYATTQAYGLVGLAGAGVLFLAAQGDGSLFPGILEVLEDPTASAVVLGNLACLALFLRLKVQNHLAVGLGHLRWMAVLFAAWFLADSALFGLWVGSRAAGGDEVGGPWSGHLVVSLLLLGCFLNRPALEARGERSLYRRSLISSPYTWALLVSAGSALAAALAFSRGAEAIECVSRAGQSLVYALALVALGRSLQRLVGDQAPPSAGYFTLLAVLLGASSLGLISSYEDRLPGQLWNLMYLSPYFSSQSLVRVDYLGVPMAVAVQGSEVPVPVLSVLAWPILLALFGAACLAGARWRERRAAALMARVGGRRPDAPG